MKASGKAKADIVNAGLQIANQVSGSQSDLPQHTCFRPSRSS